ncbi:MAG: hypothetical protein FWE38_03155 [Firmicutes bacterium]|nr:hypothetical protein [Bacillota bacterium]
MNFKKIFCILVLAGGLMAIQIYTTLAGALQYSISNPHNFGGGWWWQPNLDTARGLLAVTYLSIAAIVTLIVLAAFHFCASSRRANFGLGLSMMIVLIVTFLVSLTGAILGFTGDEVIGPEVSILQLPYVGIIFVVMIMGIFNFALRNRFQSTTTEATAPTAPPEPIAPEATPIEELDEKLLALKSLYKDGTLSEKDYKIYVKKALDTVIQ